MRLQPVDFPARALHRDRSHDCDVRKVRNVEHDSFVAAIAGVPVLGHHHHSQGALTRAGSAAARVAESDGMNVGFVTVNPEPEPLIVP